MTLLRIRGSIAAPPGQCEWAVLDENRAPVPGHGRLTDLPRHVRRVQFVIPASEVLITRAHLPKGARRRASSVLAFAIEDATLGEPDTQQVAWLGAADGSDVLAVVDRRCLQSWLAALEAAGISGCDVICETLLVPWSRGDWSLAWDGSEGILRTGELDGAVTDCGDKQSPPLTLRLALDAASKNDAQPASITIYTTRSDAAPNIQAWQRELGIPLRFAGSWSWHSPAPQPVVSLMQTRRRWPALTGLLPRLRPALWIAACALGIHLVALCVDWALLTNEKLSLQHQMEARFRSAFPDAVAVADPTLQMRRKLTEARHNAGLPDSGDFLPLMVKISIFIKELPVGSLRVATYDNSRLTLQFATLDDVTLRRLVARLAQIGLKVDAPSTTAKPANGMLTVVVSAT